MAPPLSEKRLEIATLQVIWAFGSLILVVAVIYGGLKGWGTSVGMLWMLISESMARTKMETLGHRQGKIPWFSILLIVLVVSAKYIYEFTVVRGRF